MDNRAEDERPDVPKGTMDNVTEDIIIANFNKGTKQESDNE